MSNRLPILAADIRRAHVEAEAASKTHVERAMDAGRALIEAKSLTAHGTWLSFVQEVGIPERTAQRYMTLAAGRLNSDTVSLLGGISPALRFLRLRSTAMRLFDDAESANLHFEATGEREGSLPSPVERAMDIIGEMVAMFPPELKGGRNADPR